MGRSPPIPCQDRHIFQWSHACSLLCHNGATMEGKVGCEVILKRSTGWWVWTECPTEVDAVFHTRSWRVTSTVVRWTVELCVNAMS